MSLTQREQTRLAVRRIRGAPAPTHRSAVPIHLPDLNEQPADPPDGPKLGQLLRLPAKPAAARCRAVVVSPCSKGRFKVTAAKDPLGWTTTTSLVWGQVGPYRIVLREEELDSDGISIDSSFRATMPRAAMTALGLAEGTQLLLQPDPDRGALVVTNTAAIEQALPLPELDNEEV